MNHPRSADFSPLPRRSAQRRPCGLEAALCTGSMPQSRPQGARRGALFLAVLLLAPSAGVGCRSIGPGTVRRDRLHYSAAVAESWKEQLLLNIVKTRYGDAPAFLEVSSLVSGYSLETGVTLNGQFSPENLRGDSFAGGELSGKFTDRPTISYSPMTGERFARSLLSPVPLDGLLFAIQGGASAGLLFRVAAQSCEGYYNRGANGGRTEPGDAEFARLTELLQALQEARVVEVEVGKQGERAEIWLELRDRAGHAEATAELKTLLHIPPALDRVRVVFGIEAAEPEVVALRTRSLMQMLMALGTGVQIPEEHLANGSALAVGGVPTPQWLTVHSGRKRPEAAFVSVPYEGTWFWIEREDLASKTTLSVVTVLFSYLDNSGRQSAPVLTIPTN